MLHARGLSRLENRRPIDLALAYRDAVAVGGAAGEIDGGTFTEVFHVHQLEARTVLFQKRDWVRSALCRPKNVEFVRNKFRFGVPHHEVEHSAGRIGLKFIPMDVEGK